MKIGILTQPLHSNYGGLLQAYALQQTLKRQGHEVWLINRYYNGITKFHLTLSWIKNLFILLIKVLVRKISIDVFVDTIHGSSGRTLPFTKKYITPRSSFLTSDKALKKFCKKQNFDAFIVGSDQVWRPEYAPNIYNYFLDFAEDYSVKRIAYAASFGTEEWLFSTEQTKRCKHLLHKFDSVSVRENSGVSLCSKYLGMNDAKWVLDPTMLLNSGDYRKIIDNAQLQNPQSDFVVSYLLDDNEQKQHVLNNICKDLNASCYDAKKGFPKKHKKQASVEEWLYGFANAKFAVVDSFHGCVFSILFHTPFIVIGNKKRGMARFNSLLSIFNLEDRLKDESFSGNVNSLSAIDWVKVDKRLETKRLESLSFLSQINK